MMSRHCESGPKAGLGVGRQNFSEQHYNDMDTTMESSIGKVFDP